MAENQRKIAVIGLGYVGLPVAVAFGKKGQTIGFDINQTRIAQLEDGIDLTREVSKEDLQKSDILFTSNLEDLKKADFYVVAVPTPINEAKQPDLTPVLSATRTIAKTLNKGDIVVYESTVYPGVTEEECLPLLEEISGLKGGVDFKVGYSPERINPGDKERTVEKITKVVSGQDAESLEIVAKTYESIIQAGVHRASSIKVAEAAKVIENTQRDLNISLMNELALIFDRLDIDTHEVIKAAGTKWNFLKFYPGLVGGHCIGVDPYYLTYKAEKVGYHPQVILAGRRINDNMGKYVANRAVKSMIHAGVNVLGSTVTVLGLTFKEDCPDIRNSKVIDVINELDAFGVKVQVSDPMVDPKEAKAVYGIDLVPFDKLEKASAVIVAVAHKPYRELSADDCKTLCIDPGVIIDIKNCFEGKDLESKGLVYWNL